MRYFFETEGKTRHEAEEQVLEVLKLTSGQVNLEQVQGGGIFSFVSRKPVVLRAYPTDATPGEAVMKGVVIMLCRLMGVELKVKAIGELEGNILIEISSDDSGILIGKHGRTLDALQFMVNLIVEPRFRKNQRIMLDIESYRERRQQSLTRLAKGVASRVARMGRSVALNYMNPYERRIVHLALENDERVFTRSDGNGLYKRVNVIPASRKGQESPEDFEDFNNENLSYEGNRYVE